MSGAVIERAPDLVKQKTPPPRIFHMLCQCQRVAGVQPHARCGRLVGGPFVSVSSLAPIERCVLCDDLIETHTPCQFCGVAP